LHDGDGIVRLDDGASDHEVVGAGGDGAGGRRGPELVVGAAARGPDARCDDEELVAVPTFHDLGLERRGDDAVEPGVGGERGEADDLVADGEDLLASWRYRRRHER
jgi:hypothetical protein